MLGGNQHETGAGQEGYARDAKKEMVGEREAKPGAYVQWHRGALRGTRGQWQ